MADVEYISTASYTWMQEAGVHGSGAFDGISEAVASIAEYGDLDEALNEHNPARQADNAAREAWQCARLGIGPAGVAS